MRKLNLKACLFLCAVVMTAGPMSAGVAWADANAHAGTDAVKTLRTIDTKTGDGEKATPGSVVTVDYTGWLYDPDVHDHRGKKFDSSLDRGQPFTFTLGAGKVIAGWDQGVAGMRVGGRRTLIIPADLAYGARGAGADIPPNTPLVFDIRLENVRH